MRFLPCAYVVCVVLTVGCGVSSETRSPGEASSTESATLSAASVAEDFDSLLAAVDSIHPNAFRLHPLGEWIEQQTSAEQRAPLTAAGFYTEVLRTIALAADGHMDAYPPEGPSSARAAVPIKVVVFPEGVYVVAAAVEYRSLVGAQIVEIEGQAWRLVLQRLRPLVPSDNEWGKKELLEDYVRMPAVLAAVGVADGREGLQLKAQGVDGTTVVTVDPTHVAETLPVGPPRRPTPSGWVDVRDLAGSPTPLWQCCLDQAFWSAPVPELDALYVQLNSVMEDETGAFARFVETLPRPSESGLSRLVLDLRTNRGGDATLVQPLLHAILRHWRYQEPGTLFVLISNYTFSAAVHLAADIEQHTHATFVGEATAAPPNHYGDVRAITLPNSRVEVEVSSLYWQKSDARDQREAIYPDIVVPLTWEAFRSGIDPGLAAIAALRPDDPRLVRDRRPVFNWARETQR